MTGFPEMDDEIERTKINQAKEGDILMPRAEKLERIVKKIYEVMIIMSAKNFSEILKTIVREK